jgi:BASS family bile acid:Na+ symporter
MDPSQILVLAFQASIMVTVFGFGLRATIADVLFVVRRPRVLAISLVSMFIVLPFIARVLALVISPPQIALVALVALSLSPVPPTLLGKEHDGGRRDSYGLGLMAAVSVLSIVLVPALVAFLGSLTDQPFNISFAAVAGPVLVAVMLPRVAGMLVRAFLPRLALRVKKPLALVANVVLLAAVAILIVAVFPQLTEAFTLNTAAASVAFTARGLVFGQIMAGPAPAIRRSWPWPWPAHSVTRASHWPSSPQTSHRCDSGRHHPVSDHRGDRVHPLREVDAEARRCPAGHKPPGLTLPAALPHSP